MKKENDLRNILEEIIAAYEKKVRTVIFLIGKAIQKINKIHKDQIRMANSLKDLLAKKRNLRRKDFDNMIADIRIQQAQREKEMDLIIENFCKEEEEVVSKLKEIVSEKNPCSLEDFEMLKKQMLSRPKERERKLSRMLKCFHRDQEELSAALRKLLEKGPEVKIKHFKCMIKAFQIEHQEEISTVDEMLEEFETVKEEIDSKWKSVMSLISRGTTASPSLRR